MNMPRTHRVSPNARFAGFAPNTISMRGCTGWTTKRRLACLVAAALVGCNVIPPFIVAPDGMTIVPGGPMNVAPVFGRFAQPDCPDKKLGDFLLASCGCGDWRAVFAKDDGTLRMQFPVRFYSEGDYVERGAIALYGDEAESVASGTLDQDAGVVSGHAEIAIERFVFSATRGTNHTDAVRMCVYCHLGQDPVWPRPESHPPDQQDDAYACLDCHSVGGG